MISTRSLRFINRVWNGSYFVQTSKAEIFLYNPILFLNKVVKSQSRRDVSSSTLMKYGAERKEIVPQKLIIARSLKIKNKKYASKRAVPFS